MNSVPRIQQGPSFRMDWWDLGLLQALCMQAEVVCLGGAMPSGPRNPEKDKMRSRRDASQKLMPAEKWKDMFYFQLSTSA